MKRFVIRVSFLAFRCSPQLVNILTKIKGFSSSHSTSYTFITKRVAKTKIFRPKNPYMDRLPLLAISFKNLGTYGFFSKFCACTDYHCCNIIQKSLHIQIFSKFRVRIEYHRHNITQRSIVHVRIFLKIPCKHGLLRP